MWKPKSKEDDLLAAYLSDFPGMCFMEVFVGYTESFQRSRRIDGVLVPGEKTEIYGQGKFSVDEARQAIEGREVVLLEAKQELERGVIGQVVAGAELLRRDYRPSKVKMVALCGKDQADLRWVCQQIGIEVVIYDLTAEAPFRENKLKDKIRMDIRSSPDYRRRSAFLSGWEKAVKGELFASIRDKKTHANMGNLFGWIYGDKPRDFRVATWDHYVLHSDSENFDVGAEKEE